MSTEDRMLLALARLRERQLTLRDPVTCQERLIARLVRESANTVFGREHGLRSVGSSREFLLAVPPRTYQDLEGAVQDVFEGGRDILFPGAPVCFAVTGGTTGRPKMIPLTSSLLRSSRMSVLDAALLAGLHMGTMTWHHGKTLYVGPRRGRRVGSWMVYSEGTAYAYLQHRSRRRRFVPVYDALPEDGQPQDHDALLRLARAYDITSIAGSPTEIAEFLRATATVMPQVGVIFNCGYFAEDQIPLYRIAFPNATVLDLYGANEGTFGLPLSPGCFILNSTRIFYSFIPISGEAEAVGLADAKLGTKYRLCVTTPGGLWNYLTDDVVVLLSLRPPVIRLCGRIQRTLAPAGEAITEDEVIRTVRGAAITTERYFLSPGSAGYVLHVEGDTADPGDLDARLCEINPQYAAAVREGTIRPLTICPGAICPSRNRKPVRIVPGRAAEI